MERELAKTFAHKLYAQVDALQINYIQLPTKLTRTPWGLRAARAGYAHQPPAYCTYRRCRAARPQGATHGTYRSREPASGVPRVPWRARLPLVITPGCR
jgi:hypothetical protein